MLAIASFLHWQPEIDRLLKGSVVFLVVCGLCVSLR